MSSSLLANTVSVKSIEGHITPPHSKQLEKGVSSISALRAIEAHLPSALSSISLHQASAVSQPKIGTVYKYARRLHDIPILNDWAVMRQYPENQISSIRYQLTEPTKKLSSHARARSRISKNTSERSKLHVCGKAT
ncbi:MAG: hypothetical protein P8I38_02835 [Arenicella sp.]|nr:hypothetical protein [Arenicella sp.]